MLTAKLFLEQFKKKLCATGERFHEKTYDEVYLKSKEYTDLVNRKIVCDILFEQGLHWSNEYYRIDVIGWNYVENEELKEEYKNIGLKMHSWKLEFAFEHENCFQDWNDEVIKLLYINCPLRVVVGYNDADKRDHDILGDESKLNVVAKTIEKTGMKIQGELLVILGNRGKGYDLSQGIEAYYGYRAYIFDDKTKYFTQIK